MIQLPDFYKENPRLWFRRVESAFQIAHIHDDRDRYHHFLVSVDKQILDLIPHIIMNEVKGYTLWCNGNILDNGEIYANNKKSWHQKHHGGLRRDQTVYRPVYHTYTDIKKKILNIFDELGEYEFCKLFNDDTTPMTKSNTMNGKISNSTIIRFPQFCMKSAETWFLQVEAIFSIAQITTDEEKCQQFMANLNPGILPLIYDILPITSFTEVKNRILTLSKTEKTRETVDTTDGIIYERIEALEKMIYHQESPMFKMTTNQEIVKSSEVDIDFNMNGTVMNDVEVKEYEKIQKYVKKKTENNQENPVKQNDSNTLHMDLSKHMIALNEYMKKTDELKVQLDDSVISNKSVENRLATVEEKIEEYSSKDYFDLRLSMLEKEMDTLKVNVQKFIEESKDNLNKLTTHVVTSVETYLIEMQNKIYKLQGKAAITDDTEVI